MQIQQLKQYEIIFFAHLKQKRSALQKKKK